MTVAEDELLTKIDTYSSRIMLLIPQHCNLLFTMCKFCRPHLALVRCGRQICHFLRVRCKLEDVMMSRMQAHIVSFYSRSLLSLLYNDRHLEREDFLYNDFLDLPLRIRIPRHSLLSQCEH